MKILWITNILFPEALATLTGQKELKTSGGWMLGAAEALLKNNSIELYVASIFNGVQDLTKITGNKITYYAIPYGKGNLRRNDEYIPYWKQIQSEINADIVHIHGTEFSHGHAYLKACGNKNVVISIQGIISIIAKYYCNGISTNEIIRNLTFRDILKGGIIADKKTFAKRGEVETEMLMMTKHIIGRTSWDKANTWAINPNAKYHFCNETLRNEFYDDSMWEYDKCSKHTIFLSQASYPVKGLHQLLKAMPLILRHYPDTTIRVAGADIIKTQTLRDKLRFSGYSKYLRSIIKKHQLQDKIVFTGNLNAEEMKQEYLKCNVFVCPSTIENSPNSLGEAQILGVPCVASYVGGIPDMIPNENCGMLYRFEEVEMLAKNVIDIFMHSENFDSSVMHETAKKRHNTELNNKNLLGIYKDIIQEEKNY